MHQLFVSHEENAAHFLSGIVFILIWSQAFCFETECVKSEIETQKKACNPDISHKVALFYCSLQACVSAEKDACLMSWDNT